MELVLDLHLHSRFSRAVSQKMNLLNMYIWGRKKGINVLSVGDFTHPIWFREARNLLEDVNPGIYRLKNEQMAYSELGPLVNQDMIGPYFMLSCEVSSIYSENGSSHRIHNLIFAPNFEVAGKINAELQKRGFNLSSDGRPILGLSARNLAELLFSIDRKIAIIPCHVWTPWFSLYGSRSGYDRISECFGEYTKYIFAIETGLSSDPSNNWRIQELNTRSIVSFSDAHSMQKMGREATILKPKSQSTISEKDITYDNILNAFVRGKERVFEISHTIEFYPEEGKYHYTGHRNCGISHSPSQTRSQGTLCPVCNRQLTVGVMHRIEDLATGVENNFTYQSDNNGVVWMKDKSNKRPPYVSMVPLLEILAEAEASSVSSQKVLSLYDQMVMSCGSEFELLLRTDMQKIKEVGGKKVAAAIDKVRRRDIDIVPGFDGEFGKVHIWSEEEKDVENDSQLGLGI